MRVLLCSLLWLGGFWGYSADIRKTFDLHGRVLQEDGVPYRDPPPHVYLQSTDRPFSRSRIAFPAGRFKFNGLEPGSYILVIVVPTEGEMRWTVTVGPGTAGPDGKVREDVLFRPETGVERPSIVNAGQLRILPKAWAEYEKAERALQKPNLEAALKHLKKAVEISPSFTAALNHLGAIAFQSGSLEEAEIHLREALRHDSEYTPAVLNLGAVLLSQRRGPEALEINLKGVRLEPDSAMALSQLGRTYFLLDRLDEAEPLLRKAKTLDPRHVSMPQLLLAEIYLRWHDPIAYIVQLEEFLKIHPDSPLTKSVQVRVALARNRIREVK